MNKSGLDAAPIWARPNEIPESANNLQAPVASG